MKNNLVMYRRTPVQTQEKHEGLHLCLFDPPTPLETQKSEQNRSLGTDTVKSSLQS